MVGHKTVDINKTIDYDLLPDGIKEFLSEQHNHDKKGKIIYYEELY